MRRKARALALASVQGWPLGTDETGRKKGIRMKVRLSTKKSQLLRRSDVEQLIARSVQAHEKAAETARNEALAMAAEGDSDSLIRREEDLAISHLQIATVLRHLSFELNDVSI